MTDVIINSFVAGAAQTLIGHPFDTIKTYNYDVKFKQFENILQYYKNYNLNILERI